MATTAETAGLVVDASVAVKWHLPDEEYADVATLLLREFTTGALTLVAPSQIRYEVPSAIIAAVISRQGRLTPEQGQAAIREFLSLGIITIDRDELFLATFPLVRQYGIAFYDAVYLALARELRLPLITADRRFYQRTSQLPEVRWIGAYGR